MQFCRRGRAAALAAAVLLCAATAGAESPVLDLDRLSDEDIGRVQAVLQQLDPLIREGEQREDLATLTFNELYASLSTDDDREFLRAFAGLDARALNVRIPFRGMATGEEELAVIRGQTMTVDGEEKMIPPQYLPADVLAADEKMMAAMERDLGRRLLIESGYRSSAYQLYLFVFYLSNHDYSIRETVKYVALPGYSEHGSPPHQAIDFINEKGINGEDDPAAFEALPEYAWLQAHAKEFGFVLSYPRQEGTGITFEPWHWRWEPGGSGGEPGPGDG